LSKRRRDSSAGADGARPPLDTGSASAAGSAETRDDLLMQAVVAYQADRLSEAEDLCRSILAFHPRFFPALQVSAMIAGRTGRTALGIKLLREVIALDPQSADARAELARLLQAEGRTTEVIALCQQALRVKPDDPGLQNTLGLAYVAERSFSNAAACFTAAIASKPDLAGLHFNLAAALEQLGRESEATASYRQAVALAPDLPDAHVRLGNVLQRLGQFAEAVVSFERAIAVQPRLTSPYLSIVSARKVTDADRPLIERMESLLREDGLTEQDRLNLHYGLGKAFDDLGRFEAAMQHFDEANRIAAGRVRRTGRTLDRKQHVANIDRIIAAFTPDFYSRHRALGSESELPVFILGMIRSGTTLVEQIVSSHPAIGAAGELRFWGEKGVILGDAAAGALRPAAARGMVEDYCKLLREIAPAASRVTDKMPTNFLMIGLIHLIFPRARIIHCLRDPVDTCLSIYVTPYANSTDFAHDRGSIVFYYEQYARLMAHWRRVLPADRFLEVNYEELVANREPVARQMITFCGLDWDGRCLHHERNDRIIRTPSLWQARQPVYKSSVARWRRYEPWLGEFRKLLPRAGASGLDN
jgi:tetratricopeptide (TPR) repeat protein